jgi:ethanolamine ammonia-lyase large subunit
MKRGGLVIKHNIICTGYAHYVITTRQSTSFHDALYVRKVLGLRPAPEFEQWLLQQGIMDAKGNQLPVYTHRLLENLK